MEYAFINKSLFGYSLISTTSGRIIDEFEELPKWATKTIYNIEEYGYTPQA